MREILTHIGAAAIMLLLFYFIIYSPDVKKSYQKGFNDAKAGIDTIYMPGKDSIIYRDTSFAHSTPALIDTSSGDSLLSISSKSDTSLISGKDTITVSSSVKIEIRRDSLDHWDLSEVEAMWLTNVKHADYYKEPDTIKIKIEVPKYIEEAVKWYRTDTFAYIVSGVIYIFTILATVFN